MSFEKFAPKDFSVKKLDEQTDLTEFRANGKEGIRLIWLVSHTIFSRL